MQNCWNNLISIYSISLFSGCLDSYTCRAFCTGWPGQLSSEYLFNSLLLCKTMHEDEDSDILKTPHYMRTVWTTCMLPSDLHSKLPQFRYKEKFTPFCESKYFTFNQQKPATKRMFTLAVSWGRRPVRCISIVSHTMQFYFKRFERNRASSRQIHVNVLQIKIASWSNRLCISPWEFQHIKFQQVSSLICQFLLINFRIYMYFIFQSGTWIC